MKRNKITLALALILVGCDDDEVSLTPSPEPASPQSQTYSVTAIDGYLQNAQVWLDINNNFALDEGEPQARSGTGGIAELDVTDVENPEQYSVIVRAIAGETVDEDTISDEQPDGTPVSTGYVMSAPAGETDVTPLSTLVHVILKETTDGTETDEELEEKKQQAVSDVATQLGLEDDEVLGDFVEKDIKEAAFAAENIVESEVLPESTDEMQEVIEEVENNPDDSSFLKITEAVNEKIKQVVENSEDIENESPVFEEPINVVDSDEDGVPDELDAFPENPNEYLDADGDGYGNNEDLDDDNDGVSDLDEISQGTNPFKADTDGDGVSDLDDEFPLDASEHSDNDQDGIGDVADTDDDNDGLSDEEEAQKNTNPLLADTDDDGVIDSQDAFPLDPLETLDTDQDGIGNNADTDDDNDSVPDGEDAFPLDPTESVDTDGDGIGNNTDPDDDNDGVLDGDDAFPLDDTESVDTDQDGVGNNEDTDDDNDGSLDDEDAFPLDATESVDTDEDGIGNNKDPDDDNDGALDGDDALPLDPTETLDSDQDGIGNNADPDDDNDGVLDAEDRFPLDPTESADSDNDGVGDIKDAYPNDGDKSVADEVTYSSADQIAVYQGNYSNAMVLDVAIEEVLETLNNGDIVTTITKEFSTDDDIVFAYERSVDIQSGTDFTRLTEFAYDFNLDGEATFEGMSLDIGSRTETDEEFWRYVDEGDAHGEGGVNGPGRVFNDGLALLARVHPTDLTDIDVIQKLYVEVSESNGDVTKVTDLVEYSLDGFMLGDESTHHGQWANQITSTTRDHIEVYYQDSQDWDFDGSANVLVSLTSNLDGSYIFEKSEPAWANPQDGKFQEYADFNFNAGKWDELTPYWDYYRIQVETNGDVLESGRRSVLDEVNNTELILDEDPANTLFQEWSAVSRQVSETESNKHVQWVHYPLADYSFTTDSLNIGQAYRVYQQQSNGLWVATSFDEWGSQDVLDLPQQIEDAVEGGTPLEAIDDLTVPGLSRYAAKVPTGSFKYDASGEPVQWYLVTQDYLFVDDGVPSLLSVSLEDGGLLPGAYVGFSDVDVVLMNPIVENPWGWYNAYERHGVNTFHIDTTVDAFSWDTSLGIFFLDQTQAQAHLDAWLVQDSDFDGYYDYEDAFPYDEFEWFDSDGDNVGDNGDAFPYDGSEWADTDSDGLGDNYESATEGLDPNNPDSDEDGVIDGEDLYPTDPTRSTITAQEFAQQEYELYSFFGEWDDEAQTDILYRETLAFDSDLLTLVNFEQYRGDKSTFSIPLSSDNDLQLTDSGWARPDGYSVDFTGAETIAYPGDSASRYYNVDSQVMNLSGMYFWEIDLEWYNFDSDPIFPEGAQAVRFTFSPAQDQYYLWEGFVPYVHFDEPGYDADGSDVASLDELISLQSVGESHDADLVLATSLFTDIGIELVDSGAANYYQFDWPSTTVYRIGVGSYTRETINGEDIIAFTLPDEVIPYSGGWESGSTLFFSMYQGQLAMGEVELSGAESDDTTYALNAIAMQAIEDSAALFDYVQSCDFGDAESDGDYVPSLSDYEGAIADCGGRVMITQEMVEGLNFHRVRGNGTTRDYLFNADGRVDVIKSEGGDYSDDWTIENGYIKISYLDEESGNNYSMYWALLYGLDDTWSVKFFDIQTEDGITEGWIWGDTVVQQDPPQSLNACYIGDAEPEEGQPLPSMSDYETAISDCGGRINITAEMVEGLNFQRVKGNGDTRDFLFNDDGTVHVLKGEGGDYTDNWEIENGFIKITYEDVNESFTTYWALLETLDNQWSIKLFEEEVIDEVAQAWIWSDTFVQKGREELEFYPYDVVLKEYDDNLFFFHSNGNMTYVDSQGGEEYGGYWSQTSTDTILVTFADTSSESWTLVTASDYDWTIARDGFNETFENVTYMASNYPCEDGDSDWNDELDQPNSYGTLSEYNTAVSNCRVNDSQFVLEDFTGNGSESSRWQIIDLWGIDSTVMAVVEEEVVFYSDGTGQFETEDGNFPFNWSFDGVTGQVELQITHQDLIGAVDLWDKVNQDGDYTLIKTFWFDPTWSSPAPGEGEAEIASGVVRFVGFE